MSRKPRPFVAVRNVSSGLMHVLSHGLCEGLL